MTGKTPFELEEMIRGQSDRIAELLRENAALARVVAGIPPLLEERKVAALERIAEALTGSDGTDVFTRLGRIAEAIEEKR